MKVWDIGTYKNSKLNSTIEKFVKEVEQKIKNIKSTLNQTFCYKVNSTFLNSTQNKNISAEKNAAIKNLLSKIRCKELIGQLKIEKPELLEQLEDTIHQICRWLLEKNDILAIEKIVNSKTVSKLREITTKEVIKKIYNHLSGKIIPNSIQNIKTMAMSILSNQV